MWYDKLENGYHQWEWPEHARADSEELDEVDEAEDDELWNDVQEFKRTIIEHNINLDNKVNQYENCVTVQSTAMAPYSLSPYMGALEASVTRGRVRSSGMVCA